MLRLELPPSASIAWAQALENFDPGADPDDGALDSAAEVANAYVPADVARALDGLRNDDGEHCAVLLQNAPIDWPLPPTPITECAERHKPARVSEGVLLGLARLVGEPVAYAAEKGGVLVQDVFPVASERKAPSNASSAADLDLHTELVFSRARPYEPMHLASPDVFLLLCLRPDRGGVATTTVVAADTLCASLTPADRDELRSAGFDLRAPHSFTRDGDGSRPWVGPVPLLHGPADAPRLAFDLTCGVRAREVVGERALESLRRAAAAPRACTEVRLTRGDLLLVDNRRCAHGRTSFPASFDGWDRWVQRCYVRRSLQGLEPVLLGRSRRVL